MAKKKDAGPGVRHAMLRLDQIRLDGDTQPRAGVDGEVAKEYAAAAESGAELPPVEVVFDGTDYWLCDGFHRIEGYRLAGMAIAVAVVRDGTLADARWLCLAANKSHGIRRTNADKRRAVELALERKPDLSDRAIAGHCGVSHNFVSDMRKSLSSDDSRPVPASRVGRDGRTINTENIGGKKAEPEKPPQMTPAETQQNAQAVAEQWAGKPVGTTATVELPAQDQAPLLDEGEREVPAVAAEAFGQVPELRRVSRVIGEVIEEINRLGRSPAGRCMHTQSIVAHLKSAKDGTWSARPAHVCPYCRGENPKCAACRACAGSGWVPVNTYKAAPEELREGGER